MNVSNANPPTFDELLDTVRVRLDMADEIRPNELHTSKEPMSEATDVIGDRWHTRAFDELQAQGQLDPPAAKAMGGDAHARLSTDARLTCDNRAKAGAH